MEKKEKKPRQKFALPRFDFASLTREQRRAFALYAATLCVVMAVVVVIAFFAVLKGAEKVMVPDVRDMELADALVKLQDRELYPRLTLRFTNNPLDKNMILEQSPGPGSIVKAGRRIKLTVSKGMVLDKIENYIGQDLEAVKLQLQSLFSSTKTLVTVRDPPVYRFDESAAGTILEQKPLPGEQISGPTVLDLIVSKGPESLKAKVPSFMDLPMAAAIDSAEKSAFIVDFSMRQAKADETQGKVVDQQPKAETEAKVNDRIKVVISSPAPAQGIINGIYVYALPEYPYPVPVKLEAIKPAGQRVLIASLKHPGGNFSVPFSLPEGSSFVLSVQDREIARTEVKSQ
ncbi:MAG TPA: PASTA domain-containing protein [Rectinemataceae bacterium]|nr:PASTA domain-containing protein [Rectinemataceae bacterium]